MRDRKEIKFRAWDKNKKTMDMMPLGGEWLTEGTPVNETIASFPNEDYSELMQYTGLKAKNGKEVYEGDIFWYDDNLGSMEVVWDITGPDLVSRKYSEKKENYETRSILNVQSKKIIGNIYENPDLLNTK